MLPVADLSDLKLWLESSTQGGTTTLIPYVRSVQDLDLNYDVHLNAASSAGSSTVTQRGHVLLRAGEPQRLSTLTTRAASDANCSLTVSLDRPGDTSGAKQQTFDCAKHEP